MFFTVASPCSGFRAGVLCLPEEKLTLFLRCVAGTVGDNAQFAKSPTSRVGCGEHSTAPNHLTHRVPSVLPEFSYSCENI